MHEVSIALSILKIAEDELAKNPGRAISRIHLQIGVLSGVVADSLLFALEVSQSDGVLKHAEIVLDPIKALAQCPECNHEFEVEDYFGVCPQCENSRYDIISGRDLIIKSITLV